MKCGRRHIFITLPLYLFQSSHLSQSLLLPLPFLHSILHIRRFFPFSSTFVPILSQYLQSFATTCISRRFLHQRNVTRRYIATHGHYIQGTASVCIGIIIRTGGFTLVSIFIVRSVLLLVGTNGNTCESVERRNILLSRSSGKWRSFNGR